jgi:hypothetical protein
MAGARERLIDELWRRRTPICASCLGQAVQMDPSAVTAASDDELFQKLFDRTAGVCPECQRPALLFSPPRRR